MAPGLAALPNETLALVLSNFCVHCNSRPASENDPHKTELEHPDAPAWYSRDCRWALHAMCLVSRRFQHISQSVLYHEFMLGFGEDWRAALIFDWKGRLASFVRTLAARRDLAALVKRAYLNGSLLAAATDEEAKASVVEALGAATARDYLAEFQPIQGDYRALLNPAGSKLLGVLLWLAPNLERVTLQAEPTPWAHIPAKALATLTSATDSLGLRKLKAVDLLGPMDFCQESKGLLEVLAGVGTLTALNLYLWLQHYVPELGTLGRLESIRVTQSRLSANVLAALLNSCSAPGLRSFIYESKDPPQLWTCGYFDPDRLEEAPNWTGDDSHFTASDAIQHLKQHSSTLQFLHLDLRARGFTTVTDGGNGLPLTRSLRRFTALKHLFVNASILYNSRGRAAYADSDDTLLTQLLPASISSVHLAGTLGTLTPKLGKALIHLAEVMSREGRYKALRRVRCDAVQADKGLDQLDLKAVFARAEVDFGYESWPLRVVDRPSEDLDYSGWRPLPDDDDDL